MLVFRRGKGHAVLRARARHVQSRPVTAGGNALAWIIVGNLVPGADGRETRRAPACQGNSTMPRLFASLPVALFASSAILAATPASAVDGVVLITQAKAQAGNVTPGDAAGFPVTIAAAGSYRLAGNLQVRSNRNGILVTAAEVSIDLNGFTIDGRDAALTGIVGNQRSLTVRNGTIRNFKNSGISTVGALLIVEDMRISENDQNGILNETNGFARVIDNTIFSNGFQGIACAQTCHVEGNIVSNNGAQSGSSGIFMGSGTVLGNTITGNASFGINATLSTGYGNNTITDNNGGGVQVGGSILELFPNACFPVAC